MLHLNAKKLFNFVDFSVLHNFLLKSSTVKNHKKCALYGYNHTTGKTAMVKFMCGNHPRFLHVAPTIGNNNAG